MTTYLSQTYTAPSPQSFYGDSLPSLFTTVGSQWTRPSGSSYLRNISPGRLYSDTGGGYAFFRNSTTIPHNRRLTCTLNFPSTTSNDKLYLNPFVTTDFNSAIEVSYDPVTQGLSILDSTNSTTYYTGTVTLAVNTAHTLVINVYGAQMQVTLNGTLYGGTMALASPYASGTQDVGLWQYAATSGNGILTGIVVDDAVVISAATRVVRTVTVVPKHTRPRPRKRQPLTALTGPFVYAALPADYYTPRNPAVTIAQAVRPTVTIVT